MAAVRHLEFFFSNLVFWSFGLCLNAILLLPTKFCVNRAIDGSDIAKKRSSMWHQSAILNLLNSDTLSRYCPCNKICVCTPKFIEIV